MPATDRQNNGLLLTDIGGMFPAQSPFMASRYVFLKRLAYSDFSEIELLRDRLERRLVVMKRLAPSASSRPILKRLFRSEHRAQACVRSPHVLPVLSAGDSGNGRPYFTMPYVPGYSMSELIAAHREGDEELIATFPRTEMIQALLHAAEAAETAHAQGVIHRDIKPSNILLARDGRTYLIDWGVARMPTALEPSADIDVVVGTLGYMAPEQVGAPDRVDARADVYALGAVLFEIAALESLHPLGSSETLSATLNGTSDARVSRNGTRNRWSVLDEVCVRATSVFLNERYPDARAFIQDVRRVCAPTVGRLRLDSSASFCG